MLAFTPPHFSMTHSPDYRVIHSMHGAVPDLIPLGGLLDIPILYNCGFELKNWRAIIQCKGSMVNVGVANLQISPPGEGTGQFLIHLKANEVGVGSCIVTVYADDDSTGQIVTYNSTVYFNIKVTN